MNRQDLALANTPAQPPDNQGENLDDQGNQLDDPGNRLDDQGNRLDELGNRLDDQGEETEKIYRIQDFSGPLDLLDTLLKEDRGNLTRVSLASICDQYLHYLDQALEEEDFTDQEEMDFLSSFILMAAILLDLKARCLLPVDADPEEPWEDSSDEAWEDLTIRLLVYRRNKVVADQLESKRRTSEPSFLRQAKGALRWSDLAPEVRPELVGQEAAMADAEFGAADSAEGVITLDLGEATPGATLDPAGVTAEAKLDPAEATADTRGGFQLALFRAAWQKLAMRAYRAGEEAYMAGLIHRQLAQGDYRVDEAQDLLLRKLLLDQTCSFDELFGKAFGRTRRLTGLVATLVNCQKAYVEATQDGFLGEIHLGAKVGATKLRRALERLEQEPTDSSW